MALPTFSAGQRVTGAQLQALVTQINSLTAPGWTTYTPTWSCSGSAPSLGNGTLTGRYHRPAGSDLIVAEGFLSCGSTTTYGTGTFRFALPANAAASAVGVTIGPGQVLDTGTFRRPAAAVLAAASYVTIISLTSPGDVGNGTPQTFATGDAISWSITYQAA